ncbi:MAG TPA: GlsB/YeaQ/YmgE family stress response membrane protein [Ktedonobacterales bacterium]|jgi:uncharacterized membrane protein YeaQ/YmgE (transglycosylase-associated protein family)
MEMVNLLVWIVVGGAAGGVARMVVPSRDIGTIGEIVVGMVGAVIGGFASWLLIAGASGFHGINVESLILAAVSAVVLLIIVKFFMGSRAFT